MFTIDGLWYKSTQSEQHEKNALWVTGIAVSFVLAMTEIKAVLILAMRESSPDLRGFGKLVGRKRKSVMSVKRYRYGNLLWFKGVELL